MKNYVKEGQKLPMYGVGPYLIYSIVLITALCIILFNYVFEIGVVEGSWIVIFRIIGILFILSAIIIWFTAAFKSDMEESITDNKLKTDGIYACVRNPMYTGCWFLSIGVSLMWHNVLLVPLILVGWIILTIVLKNTEEKWLTDLYGQEYVAYKARVNRCIPWFPAK